MRQTTLFLATFFLFSPLIHAEEPAVLIDDMIVETDPQDGAIKKDAKLWEDGVLPLHFASNLSGAERAMVLDACKVWESVANVKCMEGKYKGRQLKITKHKSLGCFSIWGMGTSFIVLKRWMNLGSNCWNKPTILHELGHSLGFIHEHQRPDRDDFVEIKKKNISDPFLGLLKLANFNKQKTKYQTPYDFFSIMHYPRKSFSKNGKDTIVPREPYKQYIDIMGNVLNISAKDAFTLSQMYGLPSSPSDVE